MEVDTGCGVSILPFRLYKEHFSDLPLEPSEAVFQSYFGQQKQSQGKIKVPVGYAGQSYDLVIHVVDTPGPALFGRDWLRNIPLEWHNITQIVKATQDST